jgi:hypothetical protein
MVQTIYNGQILGFEIDGKKAFNGFKAAFGPQLWWELTQPYY